MKETSNQRIASIDILRGLVMIIMALDHTRDFFHNTAMTADPLNPATTTAALFFTRWITHFCAPTFVLLSGLSAYLSARSKTPKNASTFLIKRGAWLVLAEVTIITLGLTFNPFYNFILLQVIWAIGWSMIILGVLIRTSYKVILIAGLILFFGHNLFDYIQLPETGVTRTVATMLLGSPTVLPLNSTHLVGSFYSILPWTGVMLLGYCLGSWFAKDFTKERRKKSLFILGSALILLFIVLRYSRGYGDPVQWKPGEHSLFSFLNTSKYPPSLQFCCMTIGPALILLAFFENIHSGFSQLASVYGKVPFFYFVLHLYILHLVLVVLFFASGNSTANIVDPKSLFAFRPVTFGYSLTVVYIIWLAVVAVLYLPCRWFNHYKTTHHNWWLKYL